MESTRPARQAGRFYPSDEADCRRMLAEMFRGLDVPAAVGGVTPHAGWVYSGATAAHSVAAVTLSRPETVVLFGAVHVMDPNEATVYPRGAWSTPLGTSVVDEALARAVTDGREIRADGATHAREHSIEVILPLLQFAMPDVMILPLMVRPGPLAADVGRRVARKARDLGRRVAFLASTDLTHYGPAFGFEPAGHGAAGVRWAKEVNDRRFVDLIARQRVDEVVPEAALHRNACGAGAVAALLGAMDYQGRGGYVELRHTTSAEVLPDPGGSTNSVGYEAGVFPV
jgi:AmmeMemoRadiSam system protein B